MYITSMCGRPPLIDLPQTPSARVNDTRSAKLNVSTRLSKVPQVQEVDEPNEKLGLSQ